MLEGLHPIFTNQYYGNTIEQYLICFLILLATAIIAKVIYFFLRTVVYRFTVKSKTKLDDMILEKLEKPFIFFVVIFGISYAIGPLTFDPGTMQFLNDTVGVLYTLAFAWAVIGVFDGIYDTYLKPFTERTASKLDDQILPILKKGTKLIIIALALITIINNFGYDVTAILGGLGIGALAVGLAAQDSLGNLFGGVTIFADRPFEIDDVVKIGEVEGTVQEVGLRSTRIQALDGTIVTIPNSTISGSTIENFSKADKRGIVHNIPFDFDYDANQIQKMRKYLLENIKKIDGVEPKSISAYLLSREDDTLVLRIKYSVDHEKYYDIQNAMNIKIVEGYNKLKLEMPSDNMSVRIEK
ncbi:MAG: mechanosensitive ion channel family protein [Candidatus Micrarchaeota archaeon]